MTSPMPGVEGASTVGVLILGMHRSGTSGLAAAFAAAGFDPGARVLGPSAGNEEGHWEDQFAVDLHEELLARLGTRWDQPFGLPPDWQEGAAAAEALDRIRAYLRDDRSRHRRWVLKDPRLCFFAPIWIAAARKEGIELATVLAVRHPGAVARSLHRRDGMSEARAFALWLDHVLGAMLASDAATVVVDYDTFLASPDVTRERLADALPPRASEAVLSARFLSPLDPTRRHHARPDSGPLPQVLEECWQALMRASSTPSAGPEAWRAVLDSAMPWTAWLRRESLDRACFERQLWERVDRAEARLAAWMAAPMLLPERLERIEAAVGDGREAIVRVLTDDIRAMQQQVATRDAALEALRREVEVSQGALARVEDARAMAEARCATLEESAKDLAARVDRLTRSEAEQRERSVVAEHHLAESREREAAANTMVAALTARLDEARRDNAVLAFHNQRLGESARHLDRVLASRSWRWSRPLRAIAKLLSGRWTADDSRRLRQSLGKAPVAGEPSMPPVGTPTPVVGQFPRLAELPPALPDVFVWAVIDWHFRFQRPQHLATALARKGHRVFYVSNNTIDRPGGGFDAEPLDDDGRLFQIRLHLAGAPPIYFGMPKADEEVQLRDGLAALLGWTGTTSSVALVQHPFWLEVAQALPNHRLVYDCMDHHAGFDNTGDAILEAEAALVARADLTVVSSGWLEAELAPNAKATVLIRNAGDHGFFSTTPSRVVRDGRGRPVVGYYGAIAEWFDADLVRAVALACPDVLVRLVGADTAGVHASLADVPNVEFTGEVPYADLPRWLHGFDVCLLPFKVLPLTLATNPVKVYEYLAAGKPVVAVDLPEMSQFGGLVATASAPEAFVAAVRDALAETPGHASAARQAFAAGQTWAHRAEALDGALEALAEPRVSVVVLTYNNLAFTEACLSSIELYSDYGDLELIVVDNASNDGSAEWLRQWASSPSPSGHRRRLILNERNLGFAAGNNVGLAAATGELLVMLNNDTYVTPGWVRTLCAHLRRDPSLGLVGPVTNNIGNEAKIDIAYEDMPGMIAAAGAYTRAHCGERLPIRTAAFFCVAMRREVHERVGGLDEAFGVGFFEDDDYCRRVEQAGWSIACAEDVFVHHHLSASFDALKAEAKRALFEKNKALYESKWGTWIPHEHRKS
jgi:GT2 family glycosyltransferase